MKHKTAGYLLLLLGLWAGAVTEGAQENVTPDPERTRAEISLSPNPLTSGGSITVRFSGPVVSAETAGTATEASSLLDIRPPLPGKFRWTSTRSGVFEPDGTVPLGGEYRIALRDGLPDAAGQPVEPPAPETVPGPAFHVHTYSPRWFYPGRDDSRRPVIRLYFNDSANPAAVAASAYFEDKDGNRRPVTAAFVPAKDLQQHPARTGLWEEQSQPSENERNALQDPDAAVASGVVVQPAEPLPPGSDWRLVLPAGLPNDRKTARTMADLSVHYGTVARFEWRGINPEPRLNERRALHVNFNKQPAAEHTELPKWIEIQPSPPNAEWSRSGSSVTVVADFTFGTTYTVTVKDGMAAADGTTLAQGGSMTGRFEAHAPHISLPVFNNVQWLGGKADFPFVTANLREAKVKVKRVSAENAVFLLNGYRTYENEDEPYSGQNTRIPYAAVAGKTVLEKEFKSLVELDQSERFSFPWEEAGDGSRQPGIYFVSVEGTPKKELDSESVLGAQAVVQLSDIGLAWKFSGDDVLIYAFSHATGQPLQGVSLRTYTDEAEPLHSATTGADGLATIRFDESRWILAEKDGDLHGMPFHDGMYGLNMWAFEVPFVTSRPDYTTRELMFFTERPVYQPGDTVYFKAITRLHAGTTLTLPEERTAKLALLDTQGRTVHERDIEFSETGTYSDALRLPEGSQGWFRVSINFPKPEGSADETGDESGEEDGEEEEGGNLRSSFSHFVLVQPYQSNSFRITFDEAAAALEGEKLRVPVHAAYFMGKSLSEAELTWASRLDRAEFSPDQYPRFQFCDSRSYYVFDGQQYHSMSEYAGTPDALLTGQGTVKLSNRGEAVLEVPAPRSALPPGPAAVQIDATVTDLNQQTITSSWTRTEHSSDWYLGVKTPSRTAAAGEPLPLELVAVRPDGSRWDKPVQARVLIEHLVWNAVRVQTAGGGTEVRNNLTFAKTGESTVTVSPEPAKEQSWSFTPELAGTHQLTFTAADETGREVRTVVSIDVFGADQMAWRSNSGVKIDLTADKESYRPGDTARIIVKSPLEGTALVTVEREGVISSSLRPVSPGGVLEFKIEDSWAPNVFVSVLQIRGGDNDPREHRQPEYRAGFCKLKVEGGRDRLNVQVLPESPEVRPGAIVNVKAQVADSTGRPVPNAEVALWAVDEGVLSLVPWEAPDAWEFFHYDCPLYVRTGTTLVQLRPEDPEELNFANKGFVIGGGGEEPSIPGDAMRRNFKATAYWHGSLITDASGTISVSFPAPENLTSFRIVAVASEGPARFGTAESSFRINKPLMLEPALPRFANVGDEVTLKAVLHNTTEREAELTVELTGDEHVRLLNHTSREPVSGSTITRTVTLGAMQSRALAFPVTFIADGPVTLRWKATAANDPELADSVESQFEAGLAEPLLRDVQFLAAISDGNGRNLLSRVPPELLENRGEVTISIANSRILEGADAIDQLLRYPYGCAEQTMSSMLPWLTLRDLRNAIPGLKRPDAEIAAAIQAGCDRLLSMQTSEGALGYWPGASEPSLWASAHGALGLILAGQAGGKVPADRLDSLLTWLSGSLREASSDPTDAGQTERAYAAYALALADRAEPAYHEVLFRNRASLTAAANALLALAIAESDGPEDMARAALVASRETADYWWGAATSSAMRVMALQSLRDPEAVNELTKIVAMRSARGDWSNTFTNAWVLMALSREAAQAPAGQQAVACVVTFNGEASEIALPAEPASRSLTFPYAAGGALPELSLTVPGGRMVFARVDVSARRKAGEQPARQQGFAIRRSWNRVNPDGSIDETGALRTGDLVLVSLNVDVPDPAEYLVIDDPLPATFEGVNSHFTSMASGKQIATAPDWYTDYREVKRDRVLFFRNYFPGRGTFQVRYLARVVAEGNVMVPSAKIEAMYDPSRFGLSPAVRVTTGPSPEEDVAAR